MPYTRTDLIIRVLARLGETGFDHMAETANAVASATYSRDDLVERVLHRLRDAGYADTAQAGTVTAAQLVDRTLAMLGEAGFNVTGTSVAFATFGHEDLTVRVLTRLGEVGFGQTAEPEAADRVRKALPAIFAELVATRVYLPIGATIRPEAMDALSAVVASKLSSDFALGADEVAVLAARAQAAQDVLRRLIFGHQKRVTDALPGIRAELYRGRVYSAALTDPLPAAAADAVATIAASRLSADFMLPLDRAAALVERGREAGRTLRRLDVRSRDRVTKALPGILADLAGQRIYIGAGDAIEDGAIDALSAIAASRLADDFDLDLPRVQMLTATAQAGEASLRRARFGFWERVAHGLPGIFAELYDDGVYAFPLDDTIKPAAFDPLSAIVASRLITDFQMPLDRAQVLLAEAQSGEAKLRRLKAEPYVSTPQPACYF